MKINCMHRISCKLLPLLGMISLMEAIGLCLLSYRLVDAEDRKFFTVIGKMAYQDFEGTFSPDFVFRMEAEEAFDSLSTSEKVKVLVWTGLRYKDSSSVMSAIYEMAKKHKLIRALDYHLMTLQDNAISERKVADLENMRRALKCNRDP